MMPQRYRLSILNALISILILRFISCSGISPYYDDNKKDPRTGAESNFKPLGLKGDADVVPPRAEPIRKNANFIFDRYQLVVNSSDTARASKDHIYRVQIFTSRFLQEAQQFRNELFGKFEQAIYMDFEEPYYKVRIGDFETAPAGEAFLNEVREMGYTEAWLVKIKKQ